MSRGHLKKKAPEVLIVEDSEEMLWTMANVLERAGFTVDGVTSGEEAIDRVKELPDIRILVLNYRLPDMSGLTVMKKLKSNGYMPKIVAVTTVGGNEIRDGFLKGGAFAFLEKPFDIKEFIHLCRQALVD